MFDHSHHLLDPILDFQSQQWLKGQRPNIHELLSNTPLSNDAEVQLDLIYNEIVLREQMGESPKIEEYVHQFPKLRESLSLHFEIHNALDEDQISATAQLSVLKYIEQPQEHPDDNTPQLPDYDIICMLGRGGMAVVYKARHRPLNRIVAIKMFAPERIPSKREIQRFRAEASTIARLEHDNIIKIYHVGEHQGRPYLVLEYAEYGTLADKLQAVSLKPFAAAELVETLARATDHAHKHQIIHRDIKPANVLFTQPDMPKLSDFGLAKLLEDDPSQIRDLTRTGDPIGTPRYMSPEQGAGEHTHITPAADVYALGNILYESLTGHVPFVSTNIIDTITRIRYEEPISPRKQQPSVPRDLATICLKCLEKNPERRYRSAHELADDLRRFRTGEPILARPTPIWERAVKWTRRRPTIATIIGLSALIALTFLITLQEQHRRNAIRLEGLQKEIETLFDEGHTAMSQEDAVVAESKFQQALQLVQSEPSLKHYATGVAAWLNHSQKALDKQQWKQRLPPREFDELRDEAFIQCALLARYRLLPIEDARDTIASALTLTLPDDPTWRNAREQLILLDADLLAYSQGVESAWKRLNQESELHTRPILMRYADYSDMLSKADLASSARTRARSLPGSSQDLSLHDAIIDIRLEKWASAQMRLDTLLESEPEHFLARLLSSVVAMKQSQYDLARVGLTACVAQRPRFTWTYLFRSISSREAGKDSISRRDYQRGLEIGRKGPAYTCLLIEKMKWEWRQGEWWQAIATLAMTVSEVFNDAASVIDFNTPVR